MSAEAHNHLVLACQDFPSVLSLFERNGEMSLPKIEMEILEYLCSTVAGQQLSIKAAETIWRRVKHKQSSSQSRFFEFALHTHEEELRSCGLSRAKVKTIKGLVTAYGKGELNVKHLNALEIEALITELNRHWGIGRWTAEMTAIFYFHRSDIWSEGDVALKNALEKVEPSVRKRKQLLKKASPFRSYLSLHLWESLDKGLI